MMSRSKDSEMLSMAACFLAGVAAGGAAALLLAPNSGREMRGRIQKTVEDGKSTLREGAEQLKRGARDLADKVTRRAKEAAEMEGGPGIGLGMSG